MINTFETGKACLLALGQGLPPDAEAMVCDDLRGPDSLFGEGVKPPKPTRSVNCRGAGNERCTLPGRLGGPGEDDCFVLWEGGGDASPQDAAQAIGLGRPAGCEYRSCLSVPARVFLAGRSTSSFNVAWRLLEEGAFPEWSSLVCSCQTEGRGQLRRPWHSPRGNLYVSLRLPAHPSLTGDAAAVVAGYLAVRAFRFLGFPLTLKWPNDLVIDENTKVGGILLEERNGLLLAGIGVNLSEVPPASMMRQGHAMRAGRLLAHHARLEDGENGNPGLACLSHELPLAPFALWRCLLCGLILAYSRAVEHKGLEDVLADLNSEDRPVFCAAPLRISPAGGPVRATRESGVPAHSLLAWKGRRVLLSEGEDVRGLMLGVGPGGGLLLGLPGGGKREFFSGSLSLSE